ncbi:nucleotidyl transferase AbiEii/AbiGii toxin family protein [Crossiella sp. SN42]|uniref:nucleotidyl transferase AbiEii/AbiGii toxin family protein n=1 Tax=Crossiella sp. SN42 TaxID=2944808 RepID=UPI00207CAF0A|nr:nucleotidyl transferase AbiEii/AbiGii toxin family protein [Crossiella sp. SN42]MCO1578132.1 nucleotidyl transferase AbiEii/AbiGii toxin family protein [Crossiella sp. SN42]
MQYRSAPDLRQALETRLKQQAERESTDLGRLRRRVVFDRVAARLAADDGAQWILKGGAVLEFRLRDRARATKDLDLAVADGAADGLAVRELLVEALEEDPDGDWFSCRIQAPVPLAADAAGRGAWRFSVEAWLAGKVFAAIRLDVAARGEELAATEQLRLPGLLGFADVPARSIEAVEPRQHFAEKLHALTRDYGGRPNTRVKDLVDLVLLIENGLPADRALVEVVRHVFTVRDTHPCPVAIPDPPPRWSSDYPVLAERLTETAADLAGALALVRGFWATALDDPAGAVR